MLKTSGSKAGKLPTPRNLASCPGSESASTVPPQLTQLKRRNLLVRLPTDWIPLTSRHIPQDFDGPCPMTLAEDDIDDLVYFARAGELVDLKEAIDRATKSTNSSPLEVLTSAIDPANRNGMLHMAAANGHTETVEYLLSLLPSPRPPVGDKVVSPQNSSGNTPLHWASLNGHLPVVKLLFEAGADPTILNDAGHDAVYEAEINGKEDVVGYLLTEADAIEKGTSVEGVELGDIQDSQGNDIKE